MVDVLQYKIKVHYVADIINNYTQGVCEVKEKYCCKLVLKYPVLDNNYYYKMHDTFRT